MKTNIKNILGKVQEVFYKYPYIIALSLISAFCMIYAIETEDNLHDHNLTQDKREEIVDLIYVIWRIAYVCCLGISVLFSANMFAERIGKHKHLLNIAGIIIVSFSYLLFPSDQDNFSVFNIITLLTLPILSHLLVSFIPYIKKENPEEDFWQYNQNLFTNLCLTAIFTFILTGGVELAMLAVENLFNLQIDKLYADVFAFSAIFGSCFIFLLFNSGGLTSLEVKEKYPIVLKFFTQFILIPLLFLYAIILYLYAGKILIEWSLPRGWVSFMVIAYCIVGIFALLLVYPLKEDNSKSWVKIFSKIFYYSALPFIVLLFVAIFTRILEYGYTENRYFIVLIAVWVSFIVLYFILWKKASIKFIPISLFLFGVFAISFPFLNVFSVAKESQKRQLKQILLENNLMKNGKIDFSKSVSSKNVDNIAEKFRFLSERNEVEFLSSLISKKQAEKIDFSRSGRWSIEENLKSNFTNIKYEKDENNEYYRYWILTSEKTIFPVKDFDYTITYQENLSEKWDLENGDEIEITTSDEKLVFYLRTKSGQMESFDIMPWINEISEEQGLKDSSLPEIRNDFELQNYKIRTYVHSIQGNGNSALNSTYRVSQMTILIKRK